MAEKKITASSVEAGAITRRLAKAEKAASKAMEARQIAQDVFTMFCEGKGVSGATFLSIDDTGVLVSVPDIAPKDEAA